MILGFFFLFHFLEVLSGREGFFAKKGGVSLVRNRDLRPAAKANPTIQQAFERFQKYNRLKNLSQGSLDFYAAKGRSFFRFLGDTEQPITTITEEAVEDYIFYMKDQQLHDTTINTNLRMVRAFLYWCMEKGYLEKYCCRGHMNIVNGRRFDQSEISQIVEKNICCGVILSGNVCGYLNLSIIYILVSVCPADGITSRCPIWIDAIKK